MNLDLIREDYEISSLSLMSTSTTTVSHALYMWLCVFLQTDQLLERDCNCNCVHYIHAYMGS